MVYYGFTQKYCRNMDETLDSGNLNHRWGNPRSIPSTTGGSIDPWQATCARRSMNGDEARTGAGGSDDGLCLWGIQRLQAMEFLLHPLKSWAFCWEPWWDQLWHGFGDVHSPLFLRTIILQSHLCQRKCPVLPNSTLQHFKKSSIIRKIQSTGSNVQNTDLSNSKYPKAVMFKIILGKFTLQKAPPQPHASPWLPWWQAPQKLIHQQGGDVTDLPGRICGTLFAIVLQQGWIPCGIFIGIYRIKGLIGGNILSKKCESNSVSKMFYIYGSFDESAACGEGMKAHRWTNHCLFW